jgi:hypothetical protein
MLLFNNIHKKRMELSNSVTLGNSAGVKLRENLMISTNSVLTCFQIIITGDYYLNISTASSLHSSHKAYEMKDFCLPENFNSERIQWMSKFDVSDLHLKLSDEFNFDPLLRLLRLLPVFFSPLTSYRGRSNLLRLPVFIASFAIYSLIFSPYCKNMLVFFRLFYPVGLLNFFFVNIYFSLVTVFSVLSKYLNSMPL